MVDMNWSWDTWAFKCVC